YTRSLLENDKNCKVTAVDQDSYVVKYSKKLEEEFGHNRFERINDNFANINSYNKNIKYDGIVMDLGVSSMQLDQRERGFSFLQDSTLDMRMNRNSDYSAKEFINTADEKIIADVIYKYGDEVQSRQIAENICQTRKKREITSCLELANIIKDSMHYDNRKIHPATKSFQAIRIFINKELESLEEFLSGVKNILKKNGKIIIVSFHSLEDRIVKNFFKENSARKISTSKYADKQYDANLDNGWLKIITKKPIKASKEEIAYNIRSRSAKMRIAEKIL
ncbi:MAG TPA: 16S rRNA (cytosine(1402)-N(4))-methyltransferase RsmH, partial [Candidatus Megaira endosymbiont of Hartmannula sinica]|nr:16S rRNA (cytosine(1402)-N(4))-methyltransferase RsmH [Candidatus Megaera endosymbiont of Hartmannula sinica]